jgi:hypothetical protein
MTSTILSDSWGVSAFTADQKLVMNGSQPCVFWSFRARDLENWLTTIEEVMASPSNEQHHSSLVALISSLRAAHKKHLVQHSDVVTNAPSAEDLTSYLMAYSASIVAHS